MIITINGKPGSGKSTVAKILSEKLKMPRYYIGGLRRKKAKEQGLTLAEYNKLGETDPSTDIEVDEYQKELAAREDNFIIEGRTSWHFIPKSVKIYLDVAPEIGAARVWHELQKNNSRNEDLGLKSEADVLKSHQTRIASDNIRYKKYYNIFVYDTGNFDLVIDTSAQTPAQSAEKIISFLEKTVDKK